jgi:hypothetical protein
MSSYPNESCWGIIIETDSYTGNFERELCAHLTGTVGECNVGNEFVDEEITEKFDGFMQWVGDEYGCYRPTSLRHDNTNKLVIYFEKRPPQPLIDLMKERAKTFNEVRKKVWNKNPDITILGWKLIEFVVEHKEIEHLTEES